MKISISATGPMCSGQFRRVSIRYAIRCWWIIRRSIIWTSHRRSVDWGARWESMPRTNGKRKLPVSGENASSWMISCKRRWMHSGKSWRCDIVFLRKSWIAVQCTQAGPCASRNGESGQVGNEAATANLRGVPQPRLAFSFAVFPVFQKVVRHRNEAAAECG